MESAEIKALFYLVFLERPEEAPASFGYLHFMPESCGALEAIPVIEETGLTIIEEAIGLIPGLWKIMDKEYL